jgi:hypothetical protein
MPYTEAQKRALYKYRANHLEKMHEYERKMGKVFRERHRESYNKNRMARYYRTKLYTDEAKRLRNILLVM